MTASRRLLFAFIWAFAAIVAVHALDFPGSVQDFKRATSGMELLDTKSSFDIETINARIESYGHEGRANYRFRLLTMDVLLPLSLTPFLFLLMRRAVERLELAGTARRLLLAATLVYLVFDVAENACLFVLLSSYPNRCMALETVLPYLTALKRAGILAGLLVPGLLFAWAILRARFKSPTLLRFELIRALACREPRVAARRLGLTFYPNANE